MLQTLQPSYPRESKHVHSAYFWRMTILILLRLVMNYTTLWWSIVCIWLQNSNTADPLRIIIFCINPSYPVKLQLRISWKCGRFCIRQSISAFWRRVAFFRTWRDRNHKKRSVVFPRPQKIIFFLHDLWLFMPNAKCRNGFPSSFSGQWLLQFLLAHGGTLA